MATMPNQTRVVEAGGRHDGSRPRGDRARGHARPHVQGERALDLGRRVQHARLNHRQAARAALLCGLKEELDGARERALALLEDARRREQHRCVRVVPAGMHLARILGLEGTVDSLRDGQRVHVRSQGDARRGACADGGYDARPGDRNVRNLEAVERAAHVCARLIQVIEKLWALMQLTPHLLRPIRQPERPLDGGGRG